MRWPWSKPEPTSGTDALRQAEEQLRATRSRWDEVRRVTDEMQEYRKQNHFVESIRAIMGGRP